MDFGQLTREYEGRKPILRGDFYMHEPCGRPDLGKIPHVKISSNGTDDYTSEIATKYHQSKFPDAWSKFILSQEYIDNEKRTKIQAQRKVVEVHSGQRELRSQRTHDSTESFSYSFTL